FHCATPRSSASAYRSAVGPAATPPSARRAALALRQPPGGPSRRLEMTPVEIGDLDAVLETDPVAQPVEPVGQDHPAGRPDPLASSMVDRPLSLRSRSS